ncbi:hypothetical protein BC628DRAFT_1194215 [Trametes gibbosa]|nr:hypothetical protein BC628DRAFT_1194215 [Trametes gibbosa]
MQFNHILFYAYVVVIAALGVHAADSSSESAPTKPSVSVTATNPPSSSSGAATSALSSSSISPNSTSSAPAATNSTNHALSLATFDRTLLYGAATVAGGALLGAAAVL